MSDPPFHSLAQVETYADNTAGTLVQLGLQIARVPAGTADHAAAHVGRGTESYLERIMPELHTYC